MTTWLRELAGWILLGTGLAAFVLTYNFLLQRYTVQAVILGMVAFVIFRGGLHLLKVAVAARLASDSQRFAPVSNVTVKSSQLPHGTTPTRLGRAADPVIPGLASARK